MWLRLLPYILTAVGVFSFIGFIYLKGANDRENKIVVKELKETVRQEKKYEEKRKEVIRLKPDDLRKRYCKWVRDSEELCLQANIPIP